MLNRFIFHILYLTKPPEWVSKVFRTKIPVVCSTQCTYCGLNGGAVTNTQCSIFQAVLVRCHFVSGLLFEKTMAVPGEGRPRPTIGSFSRPTSWVLGSHCWERRGGFLTHSSTLGWQQGSTSCPENGAEETRTGNRKQKEETAPIVPAQHHLRGNHPRGRATFKRRCCDFKSLKIRTQREGERGDN